MYGLYNIDILKRQIDTFPKGSSSGHGPQVGGVTLQRGDPKVCDKKNCVKEQNQRDNIKHTNSRSPARCFAALKVALIREGLRRTHNQAK